MKLEAGKTYAFKDDAARDEYLTNHCTNRINVDSHYKDGFTLDRVDDQGCGYIGDSWVMDESEYHLFKEKESEPFDISEYEFSDKKITAYTKEEGFLTLHGYPNKKLNKKDAEAIAKHFKLI
mgnify:CR=1 FL=1